MNKIDFIINSLKRLYPNPKPPLNFHSHYTLLIAVLLSASCTDKAVNKVTKDLFFLADTPSSMRKLGLQKIKETIKPCGLSERKSRAIFELSQILIEKYKEKVPDSLELLEELPGVGHKTASVVVSQGFKQNAFPVDTHIHRLAYRWKLSSGKNVKQTEKDLKNIFAPSLWNDLHLQMIYYGREYCPARYHDLDKCIICQKIGK